MFSRIFFLRWHSIYIKHSSLYFLCTKGLVLKRKLAFSLHFQLIKWADGPNNLEEIYDAVICADCLFFDEGRPQLLECLKKALKPRGIAIVVAPSRSGTFEVSSRQYLWFSVFYVSIYSVVRCLEIVEFCSKVVLEKFSNFQFSFPHCLERQDIFPNNNEFAKISVKLNCTKE